MRFVVRSAVALAQHNLRGRSIRTTRNFSSSPNDSGFSSYLKCFWTKKMTHGDAISIFFMYNLLDVAFGRDKTWKKIAEMDGEEEEDKA